MLTEPVVRQALAAVRDPILDQSLVDLGMVHAVQVTRQRHVRVDLVLPSPHWPAGDSIVQAVREAIDALPDVAAVDVQMVGQPAWRPYRIAETLRAPLGLPAVEPRSSFVSPSPLLHDVRRLLRRLLSQ